MENAEAALHFAVRNPSFLAKSGSKLYGTSTPESDDDFRGFAVPPFEYLLGIKSFESCDLPEAEDHKVYSLKRFMDLIMAGDPHLVELLYVGKEHMLRCDDIAKQVIDARDKLVSNRVYKRLMGYSYSECRKAMGERMVVEARTKDEDDLVVWLRNNRNWEKDRMDTFVEWLEEDKKRNIVPSTKNLGAKRKKQFEDFGYGASSACHSIRLLGQLTELMSTGTMTFPRPNADVLKKVRYGQIKKAEVEKVYEEARVAADKARDDSVLLDKPDVKFANDLYGQLIFKGLMQDLRFFEYGDAFGIQMNVN